MLIFPLSFWMAYTMNWTAHLAHRQSEQLRTDAVSLSLCHQRKRFLDRISTLNTAIGKIETLMTAEAETCLNSGPLAFGVCEGIIALLKAQSLSAQALERLQDYRRSSYPTEQLRVAVSLKDKNELKGNLKINSAPSALSPLDDGLARETLLPKQRLYEQLCSCQWPRRLQPTSFFESKNRINIQFLPFRELIQDTHSTFKFSAASGPSKTNSNCSIEARSTSTTFQLQTKRNL